SLLLSDIQLLFTCSLHAALPISSSLNYQLLPELDLRFQYQFARSATETRNLRTAESYEARNMINRFTQLDDLGTPVYAVPLGGLDLKSTRLNSRHVKHSYAVFCF